MTAPRRTIAVWPSFSTVGLEIAESLQFMKNIKLVGISDDTSHPLSNLYDEVLHVPHLSKVNHGLDLDLNKFIIFPAHDYVLDYLCNDLNLMYIGSKRDTIKLLRDKYKTNEFLEQSPLKKYSITNIKINAESHFPIYCKPRFGYGGQNHRIINGIEDFNSMEGSKEFVYQEILNGEEYSVECFTDKDRNLIHIAPRVRKRVRMGTALSFEQPAKQIEDLLKRIAVEINSLIDLRGPWYFQMKQNRAGDLKILEISPRIPGSAIWSRTKGVNLSEISIWDYLNYSVESSKSLMSIRIERELASYGSIVESYQHVYIDLDDTIIVNGKIHPRILAFIIQERNEGKTIHLITKSLETNLNSHLRDFKIFEFFDEIIHLKQEQSKHCFINFSNSIFIDDSFSEREMVWKNRKIPVFSPDLIRMLVR